MGGEIEGRGRRGRKGRGGGTCSKVLGGIDAPGFRDAIASIGVLSLPRQNIVISVRKL